MRSFSPGSLCRDAALRGVTGASNPNDLAAANTGPVGRECPDRRRDRVPCSRVASQADAARAKFCEIAGGRNAASRGHRKQNQSLQRSGAYLPPRRRRCSGETKTAAQELAAVEQARLATLQQQGQTLKGNLASAQGACRRQTGFGGGRSETPKRGAERFGRLDVGSQRASEISDKLKSGGKLTMPKPGNWISSTWAVTWLESTMPRRVKRPTLADCTAVYQGLTPGRRNCRNR